MSSPDDVDHNPLWPYVKESILWLEAETPFAEKRSDHATPKRRRRRAQPWESRTSRQYASFSEALAMTRLFLQAYKGNQGPPHLCRCTGPAHWTTIHRIQDLDAAKTVAHGYRNVAGELRR